MTSKSIGSNHLSASSASQLRPTVLVVEDDENLRNAVSRALRAHGYRVAAARDGSSALRTTHRKLPDLVLLDVNLPDGDGLQVMQRLHKIDPGLPTIVFTGFGSVTSAVQAMRLGAHDYLEKPVRPSKLLEIVDRVVEVRSALGFANLDEGRPHLVGESRGLRAVRRLIQQASLAPFTPVLVQGESGTGKELVARAIHDAGARRQGPFIGLNCAAIPESLLESELFGYEKGAFTGAAPGGKRGLVDAAAGGTLFLDEIGEMAMTLQAKLLRVLQERTFRPVGATADCPVDCRIVASTNRVLRTAVEQGEFRQDLYYRLAVFTIEVPPLRDRRDDVVFLARYFFHQCQNELGKNLIGFTDQALEALARHDWPGNVRELRNVIEHAVLICPSGEIGVGHLGLDPGARVLPMATRHLSLRSYRIRDMEKELIKLVLDDMSGNISAAARQLGINRSTLYVKLREYGLSAKET